MAGRSLVPFLEGKTPAGWRTAICTQMEGTEIRFSQRSIRSRDWLYVYNPGAVDELYGLRKDPGETRNLAGEPRMRAVVEDRCRELWRQLSQLDDPLINDYYTIALAPLGPGSAFRD
jgi:arylsulfatase A-like enzyme